MQTKFGFGLPALLLILSLSLLLMLRQYPSSAGNPLGSILGSQSGEEMLLSVLQPIALFFLLTAF